MTFDFYALGDHSPCLTFTATGVNLWDQMCEAIAAHVLGADPYSEAPARDIVDIVEMQTPDEAEYIEAVFVQGKMVGSLGTPFWLAPSEYVAI
ncbi:hypothetical protein UFOVP120_29 [uncultured Caudovirales phage]|uniref:Uncharacterized protein n=1 Tax=uncultured Caudovirales phage TaxID=2100421 RepID=A0A6J5LC57_9CAUD|nr:hypothetical protein UFOVP120_29 [uncultured Caudovirales phage]